MEDGAIVELYWARNESAIEETAKKYGTYCHAIAFGILRSMEDAEETVNDTYLNAWNSMPPHRPGRLSTFLGRISRNLSIDKWRKKSAEKRRGEAALALEELAECIPSGSSVGEKLEARELARSIDAFLSRLGAAERRVFVCRYWYLDSIADISRRFGFTPSKVKSMLHRTRSRLLVYLRKEGLFDEC